MVNSYSQLIVYFLIQAIASFMILVFYMYDVSFMLTLAFLMKLSMFPFFMWYINVVYSLPNFVFWLARTLHKVPPMLMIKFFMLNLNMNFMWVSIVFTTLVMGFIMLSTLDLRMLLVLSSIGNNSWFILSQMTHFVVFVLYIFVYTLRLFFVLNSFGSLSKVQLSKSILNKTMSVSFWVLTLSGMPPFPLFYCKILVLLTLFYMLSLNSLFILFILSSAFIFMSYVQSLIKHYVCVYSCNLFYLLKY